MTSNKKSKSKSEPFNREVYITSKVSELLTRSLQSEQSIKSFLESIKELETFGNLLLNELLAQREDILNLKSIIKNPHKTRQKKLAKFKVVFHTLNNDFEDPPSTGAV